MSMLRNPKEPKETQRKEFLAIRKVSPRAALAYGRQLKSLLQGIKGEYLSLQNLKDSLTLLQNSGTGYSITFWRKSCNQELILREMEVALIVITLHSTASVFRALQRNTFTKCWCIKEWKIQNQGRIQDFWHFQAVQIFLHFSKENRNYEQLNWW